MKRGFSLVELSIVLVILGLLTGGILTGQNLIRAAELRSVTTEFQSYQTAVMTFKDKYFAIPGDMKNATDFWGAMTNCGVASPSGTGTQTCNGNGSGLLNNAPAASRTGETFGFWKHLANAGLIPGTYNGIAGSLSPYGMDVGLNVPASKLSEGTWYAQSWDNSLGGNTGYFSVNYGNHLNFAGILATDGTSNGRILLPEEAWSIDQKIDDGMPGQGKVMSRTHSLCTNASAHNDFDADYVLNDTAKRCVLTFVQAF